jgi:hypothetical protein
MSAQSDTPRLVHPALLWFGLLAPPLAWIAHELLSYIAASSLCQLRAAALSQSHQHALSAPFVLITAGTLAVGLAGGLVAAWNWRKLRGQPRGDKLEIDEVDPERQHFLARCGIINSAIFITAFFFTSADILVAPLCGK